MRRNEAPDTSRDKHRFEHDSARSGLQGLVVQCEYRYQGRRFAEIAQIVHAEE